MKLLDFSLTTFRCAPGWLSRRSNSFFCGSLIAVALCIHSYVCTAAEITGSFDSGGGVITSAKYTVTGGIGVIGTDCSAGSVSNSGGCVYLQPSLKTIAVVSSSPSANEDGTGQLSAVATMDDETLTLLTGSEVSWTAPVFPITAITSNGVATLSAVYQDTVGSFSGHYSGISDSGTLQVLNTLPDNYGTYASDGLPDGWQNQYFGLNNPNAAPSIDLFGTGENNLFKYVAGLNPTNSASRFMLNVLTVAGQPSQKQIVFSPRWSDRTYTPLFSTNLLSGASFTELSGITMVDNGSERTITDTNATVQAKFYRVRIALP